jgi:large subunit ribosomal protein L19
MDWLKQVHSATQPTALAPFDTGDDIRVWYRILEQGKERFGQFEGTVIRLRGAGISKTFTVRRVTFGEGVERAFPMDAKVISKIEVLRRGHVKRSRLYYLRRAVGKTKIAAAEGPSGAAAGPEAIPVVAVTAKTTPSGGQAEGGLAAAEQSSASVKTRS